MAKSITLSWHDNRGLGFDSMQLRGNLRLNGIVKGDVCGIVRYLFRRDSIRMISYK